MWKQITWRILLKPTGSGAGSRVLCFQHALSWGPAWSEALALSNTGRVRPSGALPPISKAGVISTLFKKAQPINDGTLIRTYSSIGQFQGLFPFSNLSITLHLPKKSQIPGEYNGHLRDKPLSYSCAKTDCNTHTTTGEFNQVIIWCSGGKRLKMVAWVYLKQQQKNEFDEFLSTHSDVENHLLWRSSMYTSLNCWVSKAFVFNRKLSRWTESSGERGVSSNLVIYSQHAAQQYWANICGIRVKEEKRIHNMVLITI